MQGETKSSRTRSCWQCLRITFVYRILCRFFLYLPKWCPTAPKTTRGFPKVDHWATLSVVLEILVGMCKQWPRSHETIILEVGVGPQRPLVQHSAHNVFQHALQNVFCSIFQRFGFQRGSQKTTHKGVTNHLCSFTFLTCSKSSRELPTAPAAESETL